MEWEGAVLESIVEQKDSGLEDSEGNKDQIGAFVALSILPPSQPINVPQLSTVSNGQPILAESRASDLSGEFMLQTASEKIIGAIAPPPAENQAMQEKMEDLETAKMDLKETVAESLSKPALIKEAHVKEKGETVESAKSASDFMNLKKEAKAESSASQVSAVAEVEVEGAEAEITPSLEGPEIGRATREAGGEKRDMHRPSGGGISSASSMERMATHIETEKVAEGDLQKIPVGPAASVERSVSPSVVKEPQVAVTTAKEAAKPHALNLEETKTVTKEQDARAAITQAAQTAAMLQTAPKMETVSVEFEGFVAHPARLARVATEIQELAVELLHFKADSMAVLIRPDAETALHLHLMVIAGRVHAEARLQGGEADWLQAGWENLRRVLAEQNIVMAPLKYSTLQPSAGHNGAGHRQGREASTNPPAEAGSFAEERSSGVGAWPAKKRRLLTGWEWWA